MHLGPKLGPIKSRWSGRFSLSFGTCFFVLTFEPPWSDYGGHLGPSWGHLGLIFEPSCALLDHLGGILAHLSGSPVAKLPGRGIIDPEFFPMLQISQKSTKTKPLFVPRCQKKKRAGGGRPPQGSQSAARPLWVGARRARRRLKGRQGLCNLSAGNIYAHKSLAGVSFRPPISPQEPRAFRRAAPKTASCRACFRFKFRFFFYLDF